MRGGHITFKICRGKILGSAEADGQGGCSWQDAKLNLVAKLRKDINGVDVMLDSIRLECLCLASCIT
jgi:hypothetical protein